MAERYISEHFKFSEVRCPCGNCDKSTADVTLISILEFWRAFYGKPYHIHSWYRCLEYNRSKRIGSNDNSMHPTGGAADGDIDGIDPGVFYLDFRKKYPDRYGLGLYDWGWHIDSRSGRHDWDFRTMVA